VKRITIPHNLLPYPARLRVFDAIYLWRVAQQCRDEIRQFELQAIRKQLDSIDVMQRLTGLSKARCYSIVTEKTNLDDYPVREGYRQTPKDKDNK
jgi:hypothetical protein